MIFLFLDLFAVGFQVAVEILDFKCPRASYGQGPILQRNSENLYGQKVDL
jgi:hypothetical protein